MTPTPRRVLRIHRAGHWNPALAEHRLELDYEERHRRRRVYTTERGLALLLDEAEPVVLRDGDALECTDGLWVRIEAAHEQVVEVTAGPHTSLARLAWHIGNRHLPAEIHDGRMLIRDDHVIVHMLEGLGATVRRVQAAFTPESGAYAGTGHGHGHGHDHAHDHHHDHDHGHA